MSGIANKRPPQPRYNQIWDIQQVLDYLKALPDNDKLTLRQLTLKTVGLLALTQINRGSELKYLNLGFMRESNQTYVFSFNQHTKTSRRNRKRVLRYDLPFLVLQENNRFLLRNENYVLSLVFLITYKQLNLLGENPGKNSYLLAK